MFYNVLETVTVNSQHYQESIIETITAFQWIGIVYLLGAIIMLVKLFTNLYHITRIDKFAQANLSNELPSNVKFVVADVVPFSFLKNVYINPNKYKQKQLKEIIAHELVHINQQHTYDCLFYELLIVFFWFHPIVYKYRTSAKELHEFLADEGAISSGISGVEYQQLLFEQATGLKILTLANSFNYSLVKRRIIMLTKIKSSRVAKIRLLYVLPILGALIIAFACNNEKDTISDENLKTVSVNDAITQAEKVENEIYFQVEVMPEYPGGDAELRNFISSNVTYPLEAKAKGIEGRVFTQFIVNKEGKVEDVKVVRGVDPLLDEEAIRVISAMPYWTPGENEGKKVKVSFTVPINFQLN
ncbi:MAG: M56 family metallopeptidase [Salinivirgaceae bacterium]|nr:M56 family metallopeptidase [Salinivirgaceae bacterium]